MQCYDIGMREFLEIFDFSDSIYSQTIAILGIDFNLLDGNLRPLIGPKMADVDNCIRSLPDLLIYTP